MASDDISTLQDRLAKVLPEGCQFTVHHLSTPPTQSRQLYAAPPGELAEETHCESHFLSLSIIADRHQLQVFGIEVLIYTTEHLTTLFVSKADSTGYLYLLKLPPGTPSPLKIISTEFLRYLIEEKGRIDRRLVLSLFARAQNQYLFPGSVENSHKHVLDDRGLIKWWCKVVDPILGTYQNYGEVLADNSKGATKEEHVIKSHGFLRVPGCDIYETQSFLPKGEWGRIADKHRWHTSDPLCELGRSSNLPERCLIPRFPDDPKARFVEQLDDELPDDNSQLSQSQPQNPESPSKRANTGRWRSVRSLEQFWDMMSFRQECSSGRLVGFLWATFQQASLLEAEKTVDPEQRSHIPSHAALPTPLDSQHQDSTRLSLPRQSPLRSSPTPEIPSTPSKQTPAPSQQTPTPTPIKAKEATIRNQPEETRYYYWPTSSRGEVVLRQKDYQRAGSFLLRLDYANEGIAADSTSKWIKDVAERAGLESWGRPVVGTVQVHTKADTKGHGANPITLNAGLIRKKKRPAEEMNGHGTEQEEMKRPDVIMLSAGLVRKKAKITSSATPLAEGKSNGTRTPG